MGWLYGWESKADIVKHLTAPTAYSGGTRIVAHSVRGSELWMVVEPAEGDREIVLCLIEGRSKKAGFGYKDMSESMHPFYYNCRLSYLAMAPEKCAEWRAKVRLYHARQSRKFQIGQTVKLIGCKIPEVKLTSVKPLRGTYDWVTYRIPKTLIADEEVSQ
jgi:hypothetical protein